jgi:hypothetical protein
MDYPAANLGERKKAGLWGGSGPESVAWRENFGVKCQNRLGFSCQKNHPGNAGYMVFQN